MASNGIRDRVAIIGMGCTPFGEHWGKSVEDMLVEASSDALKSASLPLDAVDAFWLGTLFSGQSGLTLSRPLKIAYKPVSRLENYCATGSEAFRNACYAVASGAYDVAMAIGVEKLKDSGVSGLPGLAAPGDGTHASLTAPAMFSLLAPAYAKKYGVDDATLKDVMTRIAWKNHKNGALNPRAQFRKEVPKDTIACSPLVAGPLGIFDCSGVSDGSAAAIIVRAEDAGKYTDRPLYVKALSFIAGPAAGPIDPDYDYTTFPEVVASAAGRLRPGRHHEPAGRAGHGGGARLLHADRAGPDGGPGLRRARHGLEGSARGRLRPRRRAPGQSRRRAQVVRAPDRRLGPAHAVRVLAAAAGRGGQAADREHRARAEAGSHPQPRRRARRVRVLRQRGRLRAFRLSEPGFDPAAHRFGESRYFEDMRVGERFYLPSRTMTDALFAAFQLASGDNHPIHYDIEYCRARGHRGLLAHGFQVLAQTAAGAGIFPHVIGDSLIGFIEQSSRFLRPVYSGDTVYPELVVTALTPGRTTGVITVRSTVHNQRGELCLEGEQKYLVRRREAPERRT